MVKSMTEGNPLKLILNFTIPLLLGNLFQQTYNMVDAVFVGWYIGGDALARVGATWDGRVVLMCLRVEEPLHRCSLWYSDSAWGAVPVLQYRLPSSLVRRTMTG